MYTHTVHHTHEDHGKWIVVRRAYEEDFGSWQEFSCVWEAMAWADECASHVGACEYKLTIERVVSS